MRKLLLSLFLLTVLSALALPAAGAPAPKAGEAILDVYTGEVNAAQLAKIVDLGIERRELQVELLPGSGDPARRKLRVEAILSGEQADRLKSGGIEVAPKRVRGATVAQRATAKTAEGLEVFRKYSGPGGLRAEFQRAAADHPQVAKLVTVGRSLNGQDIVALKVTRNARITGDGSKPAVLYAGAQHAREWITPEMIRRLMHHVLDGYGTDPSITGLVNRSELWFIPVLNPDGYDFSFEPGQRLWRKNLRDNNQDGQITGGDGVDLNRNFPTRWGYDNEGSSPDFGSETYRGAFPASEPETRALDALVRRVKFKFLLNYHSAADLLLYGTGWQVATPTPDDIIYEAMAGDDANPAIPGYDPDISAELYTVNGDTGNHVAEKHGTLAFTPEMATCVTASNSDPDDEWLAGDCGSVFEFPDDEELVQAEFLKNLPFALAVGSSADDPDNPESVVGRTAEQFRVDSFSISHGSPQTVAVVANRALRNVRMRYRIAGRAMRTASVSEWKGGERYGAEGNTYYAELRGQVRGARAGEQVEVWFTGTRPGGGTETSAHFTYTLSNNTPAQVLIIANEDYEGVNPDYPPGVTSPKYAALYQAATQAAGARADVWDVSAQGVPHDLGVLSHYDAVIWYLGDNRFTQDPEDEGVESPFGPLPDMAVAERQQYLTMAVRDYLNEGGKLLHSGETAQHQGLDFFADVVGGVYYGLNGDPGAECVISSVQGLFDDCLILSDDFRQYYLGAFTHNTVAGPTAVLGTAQPLTGYTGQLGGPVVAGDNPIDEGGHFRPTSETLPPLRFPDFFSRGIATYTGGSADAFNPVEGTRYAGMLHADAAYARLTRTIDLTGATSAQLQFQILQEAEEGWDHTIVEARTVGQDDWTTLAETGGATSTTIPEDCDVLLVIHPFLSHYLGGADCSAPGSTGEWHSISGNTAGWTEVEYDLGAFAGQQVEVSIGYVSDSAVGFTGTFVDDTRTVIDGVVSQDGFEGATSVWTPAPVPEGSPSLGTGWQIGGQLLTFYSGIATRDTILLGFGLEQLATDAERVQLLRRALSGVIN